MQKKIIALAVAGLVSGAAFAQSNVTIYGIADVGYQYSSKSHTDGVKSQSAIIDGGQDGSRVGFKGTEDLGNGLKAFFVLEQSFALDTTGVGGRNSNIGLTGSWGTVKAGSFGSVHDDYNGYSEAGGMGWGNGTVHKLGTGDARNAVEYISPNMSGLEVKVGFSTQYNNGNEVESAEGGAVDANGDPIDNNRAFFIGAGYANGPIKAALTYDRQSAQEYDVDASEWMGAFSYNFGPVAAGIGYDRYRIEEGSDNVTRKTWRVTVAAPITANDTIGASYSRGKVSDSGADTAYKAKGWGLSYSHAMSKRTNVYATYGQISQDDELNGTDWDFALNGSYERAFKVGMRHFF